MEKNLKLKRQVQGAMVYPSVVVVVAFAVTFVLAVLVIPVFEQMFRDFGGTLPGRPSSSSTCRTRCAPTSCPLIVAIVAIILIYRAIGRTPRGRLFYDSVALKAPVLGPLFRKVAVAKFTRTLGTMISSGVPILDALTITGKVGRQQSGRERDHLHPGADLRRSNHGRSPRRDRRLSADGGADDRGR